MLHQPLELRRVLYVSVLAPGRDLREIQDIIASSRRANPARGITGALLFDGERFGQLLEGAPDAVGALVQRLAADPRHRDIVWLLDDTAAPHPRLPCWRSGYCEPLQLGALADEAAAGGPAALAAFMALLRSADLE